MTNHQETRYKQYSIANIQFPIKIKDWLFIPKNRKSLRGFSFLEVMTAVMVLSGGLVLIYTVFFLVLDYTNHLACRLQANVLLDEKVSSLQRLLQDQNQLTMVQSKEVDHLVISNKQIDFQYTVEVHSVESWQGLFLLYITVSWREKDRSIQISRELYLSSYKLAI